MLFMATVHAVFLDAVDSRSMVVCVWLFVYCAKTCRLLRLCGKRSSMVWQLWRRKAQPVLLMVL